MPSVLALVSKAVFEDLRTADGYRPQMGDVLALDRYTSKNAAFDQLGEGDAIFLVTVRSEYGRVKLWLLSIIEGPTLQRGAWIGAPAGRPIVDILSSVKALGIKAAKAKLGMSLQTPRILDDNGVALLRKLAGATSRRKAKVPPARVVVMKKPPKRKPAAPVKKPPKGPLPPAIQKLIDDVRENPDDLGLRSVLADALLEREDPWGELISLQLDQQKEKKRIDQLLRHLTPRIAGPLTHVARRRSLVFANGFVSKLKTDRALEWGGVGRKNWGIAAKAREWLTVRRVEINTFVTPNWFLEEWIHNPSIKNVGEIAIESITLARAKGSWTITAPAKNSGNRNWGLLATLLKAFTPAQRASLTTSSVAVREMLDGIDQPAKRRR